MELTTMPPVDVRSHLPGERQQLCDLLASLSDEEWNRPTLTTQWTVKGVALHLLDDDLGWLSRGRDGDAAGLLVVDEHARLIEALADKNQRWIDGAHGLSRPVVTELLRWSGSQMDAYYASMGLDAPRSVSWASDAPVPAWFDIARDLTERWVHQMQIRETVDRVGEYRDTYLRLVLDTFIWALPHQYRAPAPTGTTITVTLEGAGQWSLTCDGNQRWHLSDGERPDPAGAATFDVDSGWRWFSGGAALDLDLVAWTGPESLRDPLTRVRGILA